MLSDLLLRRLPLPLRLFALAGLIFVGGVFGSVAVAATQRALAPHHEVPIDSLRRAVGPGLLQARPAPQRRPAAIGPHGFARGIHPPRHGNPAPLPESSVPVAPAPGEPLPAESTTPLGAPPVLPVTRNAPPPVTLPGEEPAPPTESPSTPPAEEPPVAEPPHEEPPVAEPPVEKPAPEEPPVAEPPVEPPHEEPAPEKPPVVEPPAEKPAPEEPAPEKPPVVEPPHEEPPVAEPPHEEPPVAEPPVEPPHEEPAPEKPPVVEPPVEKPAPEEPQPPVQPPSFLGNTIRSFYLNNSEPGAVTEVPDPAGSGQTVFKFSIGDTDKTQGSTPNPRGELLSKPNISAGDEFWWSMKFFLPADFPASTPGWVNLVQLFGGQANGSPPFHLEAEHGVIKWQRNATYGFDIPWQMPQVNDQWVTVMVHERFASNGFVEMWIDGNQVTFFASSLVNPNGVAPTTRLQMETMDSSNNAGPNSLYLQQYRLRGMYPTLTTYEGPMLIGPTRASVGG
jgi:hypothetical protein